MILELQIVQVRHRLMLHLQLHSIIFSYFLTHKWSIIINYSFTLQLIDLADIRITQQWQLVRMKPEYRYHTMSDYKSFSSESAHPYIQQSHTV